MRSSSRAQKQPQTSPTTCTLGKYGRLGQRGSGKMTAEGGPADSRDAELLRRLQECSTMEPAASAPEERHQLGSPRLGTVEGTSSSRSIILLLVMVGA